MKKSISAILALSIFYSIEAAGRFSSISGTVQIFENDKWVKATMASKINDGTTVETGPRSSAVIIFSRGGQMALRAHTRITIADAGGVSGGTDREMTLSHGELSGFVKKDIKSPNAFRIRTPTVIAGVRGSLLKGKLRGSRFVATAQKSAAYVRPAPRIAIQNSSSKAIQKALAMRARISAQLKDARKILARAAAVPSAAQVKQAQKDKAKGQARKSAAEATLKKASLNRGKLKAAFARAHSPQLKAALRAKLKVAAKVLAKANSQYKAISKVFSAANRIITAARRPPTAQQIARANTRVQQGQKQMDRIEKSIASLRKQKDSFSVKQQNKTEPARPADSGPVVELAQGQTIIANSGKMIDPLTVAKISVRVQAAKSVGISAQEATFMGQNDDSKVGIGNDFQQIYNQINSVTQPASGGLPELTKF